MKVIEYRQKMKKFSYYEIIMHSVNEMELVNQQPESGIEPDPFNVV